MTDEKPVKKPTTRRTTAAKKSKITLTKTATENLKNGIKKFTKIVEIATDRNLNESDTSNIINDMLGEMLGYDKFFDVTTEYKIKWQFADYGVKIDDKLKFLIEVKAVGINLNDNHIFQAASYASTEGVEWVILTNLREWNVYHLSFGSRIDQDLVLSLNFSDAKTAGFAENFAYLHKEAIKKNLIKDLWNQRIAMSGNNFKKVLTSSPVLKVIQRELVKASGVKVGEADIAQMLGELINFDK